MLHLFNFTFLFGMLYILLYSPVKKFMAERENTYASMDSKANDELKAAEAARQEYDDKVRGFDEEVRSEKTKLHQEMEEQRSRELAAAKADAEKIVSDARSEASRQKDDIINSAQQEIAEMLTEAMEKLTLEQSASEAFDQFLDATEAEKN